MAMKLYFSPGSCALAVDISLREAGMNFDSVKVDLRSKKTANGDDYLKINHKGYVPALQLDNGQMMTEAVAIMQWVADQASEKKLIPAWGTTERYKAIEWLNFLATELHKTMSPMWNPSFPDEARQQGKDKLALRFEEVETQLKKTEYLLGNTFTVCDAYLFTLVQWTPILKIDMAKFPRVMAFHERVKARPKVQEAIAMEKA